MIARCARCHGTFTTDRFGLQRCPHCGAELLLSDPNAPRPAEPARPPPEPTASVPPPAAGAEPGPATPEAGAAPPGESAPAAAPEPPQAPAPGFGPPPTPSPGWGAPPPPPPGWGAPSWGAPAPPGPAWGTPPPPPEGTGAPEGPSGTGWQGPPPPPGGGWAPPPGGGWPPPPGGPGGPRGPAAPELPAPFAERATRGFVRSYVDTWKLVATRPSEFFRRVRIDQSGSAVLFAVISYTIGAAAQGLYTLLSGGRAVNMLLEMAENMPEEQARVLRTYAEGITSGWSTLGQVVFAPVIALVALYLGAGILHLLLTLFRGASRGFDATLTTLAYAYGLALFLAVPGCGGLVAAVWLVVVAILGLAESQRCGTGKSAAAVLAPVVLTCFCCCGAGGLGLGGLLRGLGTHRGGGGGITL